MKLTICPFYRCYICLLPLNSTTSSTAYRQVADYNSRTWINIAFVERAVVTNSTYRNHFHQSTIIVCWYALKGEAIWDSWVDGSEHRLINKARYIFHTIQTVHITVDRSSIQKMQIFGERCTRKSRSFSMEYIATMHYILYGDYLWYQNYFTAFKLNSDFNVLQLWLHTKREIKVFWLKLDAIQSLHSIRSIHRVYVTFRYWSLAFWYFINSAHVARRTPIFSIQCQARTNINECARRVDDILH